MLLGEVTRLPSFDINHANHPVLDDERDGQLRAHVGNRVDIAFLCRHIIHQDRFPQLSCPACDALAHPYASAFRHIRRVTHLEADSQLLCPFV